MKQSPGISHRKFRGFPFVFLANPGDNTATLPDRTTIRRLRAFNAFSRMILHPAECIISFESVDRHHHIRRLNDCVDFFTYLQTQVIH
jgi:hypothetical protein